MKIVMLNAATLPVYRGDLAHLLCNATGYPHPPRQEEAEGYFHSLRASMAKGERLLWIARDEEGVVGSVQLKLPLFHEGQNRAEIQRLLVHQRARRRGVGKRLLAELERTAQSNQRGVLCLHLIAGSPAEAFYRAQGYRCLGELPDYATTSDGHCHAAMFYYKRLFIAAGTLRAIAS
ncbi:GNAT family N-acetyltransferase [Enterobacterales bacterium CwR94]|nr:GNAT family N-acetyltransferase [Enterobacterales bacterium CwR94]